MYIYVYKYMNTYTYTYIHTRIHTHTYAYLYTYYHSFFPSLSLSDMHFDTLAGAAVECAIGEVESADLKIFKTSMDGGVEAMKEVVEHLELEEGGQRTLTPMVAKDEEQEEKQENVQMLVLGGEKRCGESKRGEEVKDLLCLLNVIFEWRQVRLHNSRYEDEGARGAEPLFEACACVCACEERMFACFVY